MTTETPTSTKDFIKDTLTWSRGVTDKVLAGWPEDKWTFQATDADCHALWVLGHLAVSDAWMLGMVTDEKSGLPDSFNDLFQYGTDVNPDASAYPPASEVRGHYERQRARIMTWLDAVGEEELHRDLSEVSKGFAKTPVDLLAKEAWHEGWHAGQLSTLRRALGLGPALGDG